MYALWFCLSSLGGCGSEPIQIKRRARCFEYYVSYSSEPPAFVIIWSDPFGAVEIVWGNLRYMVEALDLIFQSRIIPGLLLPVGLLLLIGSMAVI